MIKCYFLFIYRSKRQKLYFILVNGYATLPKHCTRYGTHCRYWCLGTDTKISVNHMSITWTWAYSSFSPLQVLKNPPFSLARNILNGDKSHTVLHECIKEVYRIAKNTLRKICNSKLHKSNKIYYSWTTMENEPYKEELIKMNLLLRSVIEVIWTKHCAVTVAIFLYIFVFAGTENQKLLFASLSFEIMRWRGSSLS